MTIRRPGRFRRPPARPWRLFQVGVRDLTGAGGIDPHGHRLDHPDGIGQLHLAARGQPGGDHVLGHVSSPVGARAVDLGRVLAREAAAPVAGVTAVGVDLDLAPGEAGVGHRAADDEPPAGVDVALEAGAPEVVRDDGVDHLVGEVGAQLVGVDLVVVLGRDDHALDHRRPVVAVVCDGHLDLPVGAQVGQRPRLADLRQPPRQAVRERDRQRHQLRRLVAGEAEHHPAVAGAAHVDAVRDVRRLLVDADQDAAGLGVEAVLGACVADLAQGAPDDARDVHVTVGGDLPADQDQAGGDGRLAGHPRERVLGQDGVQDGIRYLVGDLVGVALGDRLRREARRRARCDL